MAETAAKYSPELNWLLDLLRTALGTAAAPKAAPTGVDWTGFIALAERHRVGAFLHQRVKQTLFRCCPAEVCRRTQEIGEANAQRALFQAAELIRLTGLLRDAGVEALAVKGLATAQRHYGGLGARHAGDIDLFVRSTDALAADAAIQAAGLRRTRPDFPLTALQAKKYLGIKPEFEYWRGSPALRLELLWRLEGLPEEYDPLRSAVPLLLGGASLRALAPDADALYLLLHGARHAWFRLFWLVDAALLFQDDRIEWGPIVTRARALGLERAVLQAARLSEDLLGVRIREAVAGPGTCDGLVREARRQIARPVGTGEGMVEWARQALYRVRLARRMRGKFQALTPHLFSPESWRAWPLPDRWFFLYYPAAPILWIWRRLRRGRSGS